MKQNIIVVPQQVGQFDQLCISLQRYKMDVLQIEDPHNVLAGLELRSPAFLLLDYHAECAAFLLREISKNFFRPQPYMIVSDTFSDGMDRAALLNEGADACVGRPVDANEVIAVIRAVFRREQRISWSNSGRVLPCIEYSGLSIDPLRRIVMCHNRHIDLTAKEFDLLYLMASRPNAVISKEELYEAVWKISYDSTARTLTDHIFSLRRKMKVEDNGQDFIQTVHGVGYRFVISE